MVARSNPITVADFSALAAIANARLLPLVNAAVAAGAWPGHFYDRYTNPPNNTVLANPQPAYAFGVSSANWLSELNRIRADYFNLILHSGLGADDLFFSSDNLISGPWVVGVNDPVNFPAYPWLGGTTDSGGLPGGFAPVLFPNQFITALGELFGTSGLIFGGDGANWSTAPSPNFTCLKNVKFCYAENDAPDGISVGVGRRLDGGYADLTTTPSVTYVATVAGQWTCQVWWQFRWTGGGAPPANPPAADTFTTAAAPAAGVTWSTCNSNVTGLYGLIATIDLAIAPGTQTINFNVSAVPANFVLIAGNGQPGELLVPGGPKIVSRLIYASSAAAKPLAAVHPTSKCLVISVPDLPANSDFTVNGNYSIAFWKVSDPNVKGVWMANTLPIPGQNVFIDQDMPPYVGKVFGDIFHGNPLAISDALVNLNSFVDNPPTNQKDNSLPCLASSMRQQAFVQNGEKIQIVFIPGFGDFPFDLGPKYNLITRSLQTQPAQWLLQRDTDPMPMQWGTWGNPNQSLQVTTGFNMANGSVYQGSVAVDGTATKVKIRLRTASPKNGGVKVYDGGDLPVNLRIYVSQNGIPNPNNPATYDFFTQNNQVIIPKDGGAGYLTSIVNRGFNYAIKNTTGGPVAFDLIFEIERGLVPREPQFHPRTNECFSFFLFADPPAPGGTTLQMYKPIPQNGYCIFKVRATRRPVANAAGILVTPSNGEEINITLGQNKLQFDGTWIFEPFFDVNGGPGAGDSSTGANDDQTGAGGSGTPFTITIPANARDSGDVEVFIPVLFGNPLVWQGGDDVIVEAWANWQPIFFGEQYAFGAYFNSFLSFRPAVPSPMTFQYCLAFYNRFDYSVSNNPEIYGDSGFGGVAASRVQFPMSVEIYNDLMACLNLI